MSVIRRQKILHKFIT